MSCIALEQGRYLETFFLLLCIRGAPMHSIEWDPWAICTLGNRSVYISVVIDQGVFFRYSVC